MNEENLMDFVKQAKSQIQEIEVSEVQALLKLVAIESIIIMNAKFTW